MKPPRPRRAGHRPRRDPWAGGVRSGAGGGRIVMAALLSAFVASVTIGGHV